VRRHGGGRQGGLLPAAHGRAALVSRRQHVEIAISVAEKVRQLYPGGLPTADLRSPDEPLLGISGPEAGPARLKP
jgi:hypothetical protein